MASVTRLQDRANLLTQIRGFFLARDVMEVTTPCLGRFGVTSPHIESMAVELSSQKYYLQTSPEYAMKRLLAEGAGAIYQIAPAFRAGEAGRKHNPEFSLLEWYRPGLDKQQLMDEVTSLIVVLAKIFPIELQTFKTTAYRKLFEQRYAINPHVETSAALYALLQTEYPSLIGHIKGDHERDAILDALFTVGIEAQLQSPTFVTGFPASQAALAEIGMEDGHQVALRFELYWQGVELANGYVELRDKAELKRRADLDNKMREKLELPVMKMDPRLLHAMDNMPPCCGVALGLDRLLMLLTAKTALVDILSFDSANS